ncbi:septal ring lytic transglycosylase RlpA family protein [Actinomadura sp. WMMB 499]|uniref:septal ring lytic transglycosylase RlpA family protein n=1 Tax=Actinomadura sp. WMMB 499 TaxID=1219491 RepID=UPI0020C832AC|nr:septal ring lytic transglycosylase RlpA family protein [Actinomadura sp. WMMB 499]
MRIRTLLIVSGAAVAVLTAGAFAFVKTGASTGAAQAAHGLPQAEPSAPPGGQSPGASPPGRSSPSATPEKPKRPEKPAQRPDRDDEPDAVAARIDPPEPEPEETGRSRSGGSSGSGGSEKVLDSGSCKASFYGEGQMTASGERFDPSELTAAHKTLPFGSKVRVTNKSNGDSVVVRINDRGPYAGGRCLDLSEAAMRDIGGTSAGVISVRYEVLSRG